MRSTARLLSAAALSLALPASASASGPGIAPADPAPPGVTLSSTGLARLKPPARLSERSIQRAFAAAHRIAVQRAINQVRERSDAIARADGLKLGGIVAVVDTDLPYYREFGAERFCRRGRRPRCR